MVMSGWIDALGSATLGDRKPPQASDDENQCPGPAAGRPEGGEPAQSGAQADSGGSSGSGEAHGHFWFDQHDDAADRRVGRRIECPVLLITGEETQHADAPTIWRGWARDLHARTSPGGHFLPEEAPQRLATALVAFLHGRSAVE
jgi:pimeloyl-ACP methyl ester carboxylesterase